MLSYPYKYPIYYGLFDQNTLLILVCNNPYQVTNTLIVFDLSPQVVQSHLYYMNCHR